MQIGLQQMKDKKSTDAMHAYMVPNSRKNGILGIKEVLIKAPFTENDFDLVQMIF